MDKKKEAKKQEELCSLKHDRLKNETVAEAKKQIYDDVMYVIYAIGIIALLIAYIVTLVRTIDDATVLIMKTQDMIYSIGLWVFIKGVIGIALSVTAFGTLLWVVSQPTCHDSF